MYILNLAYRWNLSSTVNEIDAVLLLPTGNNIERLERTPLPETKRRFFDPQLYLSRLDARECPTTCSRLVTYPWFFGEIDGFDSEESTRQAWEKKLKERIADFWRQQNPDAMQRREAATEAITFQRELGCSYIILPSPLTSERENEAAEIADWIDDGLAACRDLEIAHPVLATVAIDQSALNDAAFCDGGFLDTVIDHVTSREDLDGVYLVIAQTHSSHPFNTDSSVLRAYVQLTKSLRRANLQVFVNFAGVFGKVCMGFGAVGFAAGASQAHRRLSLADFKEPSFGISIPKFYSDQVIGEFSSETDLNEIVRRRLLRRIRDITPYSQSLFETLESGGTAADIPEWAESRNNTSEAYRHFVARLALASESLQGKRPRSRMLMVRDWLESAAAQQLYIDHRLEDAISPNFAPASKWLDIFDGA